MAIIITTINNKNKAKTIALGSNQNILVAAIGTARVCIDTASKRDGKNRMKVADVFIELLKREMIRSELENFADKEKDHG